MSTMPEPTSIDLDELANDVRYAGGNGTSDYWRGFNDGIDKLVAALEPGLIRATTPEAAPEHVGRYEPECSCGYQGQGRDFDEARRDVERHQIEAYNASVAPTPTTEETT